MYFLPLIPVAAIVVPLLLAYHKSKHGKSGKKFVIANLAVFALVMAVCIMLPLTAGAAGEDTSAATATASETEAAPSSDSSGLGFIAMAIATGVGSVGSGIAVAAAAPAAIGATAEDPKAFGKSIVFVGLAEGIGIYGVLISILIFSKL